MTHKSVDRDDSFVQILPDRTVLAVTDELVQQIRRRRANARRSLLYIELGLTKRGATQSVPPGTF